MHRPQHDPDQAYSRQRYRMKVDPRQILTLEAFGIGSIILSAVVLAALLYSIW